MYNHQLDTFLSVAESGSFAGASKELFITSSAVLQQINSLESSLGVRLLKRSNQGIQLTPAGEYLYREVPRLVDWDNAVRQKLKLLDSYSTDVLRVGVPTMHKSRCFYELWTKYSVLHPEMKIDFVESPTTNRNDISSAYSTVDLIEYVKLPILWQKDLQFLRLGTVPLEFGIPLRNKLAKKNILRPEDLNGARVVTCDGPFYQAVQSYAHRLEKAGATIIPIPEYSLSVMERCILENCVILLPACSAGIHAGFRCIRCDWDASLPYGFFYSHAADTGASSFMAFVREQIAENHFWFNMT